MTLFTEQELEAKLSLG